MFYLHVRVHHRYHGYYATSYFSSNLHVDGRIDRQTYIENLSNYNYDLTTYKME